MLTAEKWGWARFYSARQQDTDYKIQEHSSNSIKNHFNFSLYFRTYNEGRGFTNTLSLSPHWNELTLPTQNGDHNKHPSTPEQQQKQHFHNCTSQHAPPAKCVSAHTDIIIINPTFGKYMFNKCSFKNNN